MEEIYSKVDAQEAIYGQEILTKGAKNSLGIGSTAVNSKSKNPYSSGKAGTSRKIKLQDAKDAINIGYERKV